MTDTDLPEEVPKDLNNWLAAVPKQQTGETYMGFQYRKLLAIQAQLANFVGDDYEKWADARNSAEENIAKYIAASLEDVVIKLTCLTKNMRVHGNARA